jgi:hypothetical protein
MIFTWDSFVQAVAITPIQYPLLRVAYLSQCILESGRGSSFLFGAAGNPTGIKWRPELQGFAAKKFLVTPTEPQGAEWCYWEKPEKAVLCYWQFISRPIYSGWEDYGGDPAGYIQHIWESGYATDPNYVQKVVSRFPEANSLIKLAATPQMPTATWFLFQSTTDGSSLVRAMVGSSTSATLNDFSKDTLIKFLDTYESARTFLLSPDSGIVSDDSLSLLSNNSSTTTAISVELRRADDGIPVILALDKDGEAIAFIKSKFKEDLVMFLAAQTKPKLRIAVAPRDSAEPKPGPGSLDSIARPEVEWVGGCPNQSSRNGARITSIVQHYTTSRSIDGTISHFLSPSSRVSSHYIIAQDGKIVQIVKDSDKAWHCLGFNANSIGIEHSAEPGDPLTDKQSASSARLVNWLVKEYGISKDRIYGHRWNPDNPGGTDCPGDLWPSISSLESWVTRNIA